MKAEEIFEQTTCGKYIFGSIDLGIAAKQHQLVYDAMKEYARLMIEKDRESVESYPNDGIILLAHRHTPIILD